MSKPFRFVLITCSNINMASVACKEVDKERREHMTDLEEEAHCMQPCGNKMHVNSI